jgi:hypothetical protein
MTRTRALSAISIRQLLVLSSIVMKLGGSLSDILFFAKRQIDHLHLFESSN